MLADVFKNFWNICLEVYVLDPTRFLSVPISIANSLEKNQSKIRSIN